MEERAERWPNVSGAGLCSWFGSTISFLALVFALGICEWRVEIMWGRVLGGGGGKGRMGGNVVVVWMCKARGGRWVRGRATGHWL